MVTISKRFKILMACIIVILLIPLIGMQFSNQVNWTIQDFIVAGLLLFSASFTVELFLKKFKNKQHRIIIVSAIIIILILIWIELAVGIFGSPLAGS
ncbi:hypothetical protein [Algibacter sp. PT7-4]|uniref:hypothetical protein n=1 Tax=Algibacter ulvanivorans TaxID=3400999 RepID=UPI003AABBB6E